MEWTPLDERARLLFHLQALSRFVFFWLPAGVIGGAVLAATVSLVAGLVVASCLLFLIFVLSLWMPTLVFDRWGFHLRDDELLITSGVLLRRVVAIPTSRIQHVDSRQGVLEQWMGLSRVRVYTASGIGADGVIPGLDIDDAEALRDRLVRLGGLQEDDGGV